MSLFKFPDYHDVQDLMCKLTVGIKGSIFTSFVPVSAFLHLLMKKKKHQERKGDGKLYLYHFI